MSPRRISKPVQIGDVTVGGGSPIVVQSMTKTDTRDVMSTITQIKELEEYGCQLVRVAVPDVEAAQALRAIKKAISIPLIADIHFNYRLALMALEAGADGLVPIDTVRSLIGIDIDQGRPLLPAFGGLSGPAIKPLSLFSVASVAKAVKAPISASGGIATWRDVIEFMMAGASTVQLCTVIMWRVMESSQRYSVASTGSSRRGAAKERATL